MSSTKKVIIALLSLTFFLGVFNSSVLGGHKMPESSESPFPVEMAVFIVDVDDIDGAEQNFTANVYYMASWYDPNVAERFNEKDVLPATEVWTPNIQVVNQQKIWPTLPEVVEVYPDGLVIYRQRVWGQFSMPFDLRDFPFDTQDFVVQLVSIGQQERKMEIAQSKEVPSGLADKFSQADWEILDWKAEGHQYRPMKNVERDGFMLTFLAKRKTGYYIIKIIIPLVLIVMMSWAVYWIDPKDAGTQVGVAVTSMLTLIAYRFATDALLPKVSYLTRLDYFILGSTILIFSGLVEVLMTTALAKRDKFKLARTVDRIARIIMPLLFAAVILKAFLY